jgi:D-alanine-D-alanine ligase
MFTEKKIIILTGGFSNEREVALRSGNNVFNAFQKLNYKNIELFDLKNTDSIIELVEKHKTNNYDLAFLTTHGRYGEDGCLQGLLEMIELPYTGARVMQSAICMNKKKTKQILFANELPILTSHSNLENLVENEYILKPNCEGSSVGIEKFNSKIELQNFVAQNSIDLSEYLIERFVKGFELTASIINYDIENNPLNLDLQNQEYIYIDKEHNLISLPLLELRPKKEFYDYEAKYTKGMTEFILPASLGQKLQEQIHQLALKAYLALDLSGLARIDFLVDKASKEPFILELNTLPGMTELSDAPAQALHANISYEKLVEIISLNS